MADNSYATEKKNNAQMEIEIFKSSNNKKEYSTR